MMLNRYIGDPVEFKENMFYFWDETQTEIYGPYSTLEECDK